MPADQPLPCPFCGGPTEVRTNDDNAAWVRCMKRPGCEAEGPVIKLARPADAQGRAIAAWNRIVARTPDPRVAELAGQVAALREALLEVQNSADPDELIDRALSTDAGKREAAVIAAARGVVLSRPSEYYEAIDDLYKAVDALDAGGRDAE